MRLVEQHIIEEGDPRLALLDATAFASKNLWNAANYLVRQSFIFEHDYLDNVKVFHLIKSHQAYQALPRKVGNQVLIQLHTAWVAFFEAMRWFWDSYAPEGVRNEPTVSPLRASLDQRWRQPRELIERCPQRR